MIKEEKKKLNQILKISKEDFKNFFGFFTLKIV